MKSGVYSITHRRSGKRYVGSSYDVERRMRDHIKSLQNGTHYNILLQRAWAKYGPEEFDFAIIERCRLDGLLTREQYWIDQFKATDISFGYNLAPTAGSALGVRWGDESKAARSKAMKEFFQNPVARKAQSERIKAAFARNPQLRINLRRTSGTYRKARPLSDEHKARISAARIGHIVSKETRHKIATAFIGRKLSKSHRAAIALGVRKFHSAEHRANA